MTKPILNCAILFLCLSLFTSCDLSKDASFDFTIKVCGTEGLKFSGHYSIVEIHTLPEPINAQGIIPMEYKGKGAVALCSFRKLTKGGSLKVEILKDGKVISGSETSISYGVVSLKTPIPEKNAIFTQVMRKLFSKEKN
jgi:hypothetical protein